MKLNGVHLLQSYRCVFECDHCFVWGSPRQSGTMSLATIRELMQQARDVGTVEWMYFEGGEPFLFYAVLRTAVQEATRMGFKVGIVSNAYWATDQTDAVECLKPLAALVQDFSISSDLYHYSEELSAQAKHARAAAEELNLPLGVISIAQPNAKDAQAGSGQLPAGQVEVRYRGRAADQLADKASKSPWRQFSECPYEDLVDPGRVHIDHVGNVHLCQGLSIGNVFRTPLREICEAYVPEKPPIIGPLLEGGPAGLADKYGVTHQDNYADACHLCYEVRSSLRARVPDELGPDQMYGVPDNA